MTSHSLGAQKVIPGPDYLGTWLGPQGKVRVACLCMSFNGVIEEVLPKNPKP